MTEITFEGKIGGDCECFCWWEVPAADKIKMVGKEEYEADRIRSFEYHTEMNEDTHLPRDVPACVEREMGQLYPNDIFSFFKCEDGKKYRFKISVEEVAI